MDPRFTLRLATSSDLAYTDQLEKEALPIIDPYYRKNIDIFSKEIPGDLIMVFDGDMPLAMGRYSFHPDGTMWLETVRVRPDYQGKGIGTAIYEKYLDLAREKGVGTVRLYTESFNDKSMALSGKMGFSIIHRYDYYSLMLEEGVPDNLGFEEVRDLEKIMAGMKKAPWTDLLCMNNVFYEVNEPNIRWFLDRGMVFSKGESLMILGARHNRDSVAYLAYLSGDMEACIQAAKAMNPGKTLSVSISKDDQVLGKYFKEFEKRYDLIVSERKL